ncbi:hypothetical protein BK120_23515 [Paenibacillus sp. FSL A5-0031]|uniref:F510_1955 family glycosylhydrolase n=1 Tax=Paenibacillus sp. FSL A5-0031 TaxID=1920420 RepID=UPI00096FAD0A|nr:hypothetical protein [Paenibacillus sp. FSL A5-0031]OME78707.1 hypothetical protein BK120_23515 [Paenibacillus sp. FSL A5-0031]
MNRKKKISSKNKLWLWAVPIAVVVIIAVIVSVNFLSRENDITLKHIHGLGFTNDGTQLLIPAHEGLISFSEDHWKALNGKKHDYMGLNMTDNGFYSSGHPEFGSGLRNPLGIVKSNDYGENLEILDLYGVEDFHGMAVGYQTHTIYVINAQPNERMSEPGLYVTTDETKSWRKSEINGINSAVSSISAHPTNPGTVAVGTSSGVFLSNDYGDQFKKLASDQEVTALAFGKNGDLFIGGRGTLQQQTGNTLKNLSLTSSDLESVIVYIAQNPQNDNEIAYATSNMDVFVSKDSGLNWNQITEKGSAM